MNDYVKAILFLRPNAEFVLSGDDLDDIIWHKVEGNPPTKKEILDAIKPALQAELDKEAEKLAKKAELLAKLGITEDEARLLLS